MSYCTGRIGWYNTHVARGKRGTQLTKGETQMKATLIRIDIRRDENEYGEQAYLVTPLYRRDCKVMTVPDAKGWPTLAEAEADADRILNRRHRR
jgi:hypothetical protein